MKVTERAVVCVGTVSRALNNDIHVAPDARERVSVVLCELGYVANLVKGRVDGLLLILLCNPADYIGTLTNTSFPLVLSITKTPAVSVRLLARSMECRAKNLV